MHARLFLSMLLLLLPALAQAAAPSDEYPMRARYPDAQIITTAELATRYADVLIVDVRTKYEYNTLHIKDAVNVPLGPGFGAAVNKLRATDKRPFVFYCNGKTCHKSYEAALLADKARVTNVYAYDAGIFDWARANPERTTLRGKSPIQVSDLISEDRFKARLMDSKAFAEGVGPKTVVLDVRDRAQRDTPLFPFHEQRAQLDETKRLDAIIEQARSEHKTLLIYDEVGKQVQWFQYHLESKGFKDYYFMKGGAQAYYDATLGKVVLGGEGKAKLAK